MSIPYRIIYDSFMGGFNTLDKIFNLNRKLDNQLAIKIFQSANETRVKEIEQFSESVHMGSCSYDRENGVIRYSFMQCPNAEFAKRLHKHIAEIEKILIEKKKRAV